MKTSELISHLQAFLAKHGDLEVEIIAYDGGSGGIRWISVVMGDRPTRKYVMIEQA